MPLTDTQVRNAKPGQRPPTRRKGVQGSGSDEPASGKQHGQKAAQPASAYKTKSGDPPKSYKLYDGENLYIEIFQNSSKIWRFRFKFPKENVISLGKYPKVPLAKAREARDYKWMSGSAWQEPTRREALLRQRSIQIGPNARSPERARKPRAFFA